MKDVQLKMKALDKCAVDLNSPSVITQDYANKLSESLNFNSVDSESYALDSDDLKEYLFPYNNN